MKNATRTMLVTLGLIAMLSPASGDVPFIRGDTNADGVVDVVDAENILTYLFGSGCGVNTPWWIPALPCEDAFDVDDNGDCSISDVVTVVKARLGLISPGIPAPYPSPGADPSEDGQGCQFLISSAPIVEPAIEIGVEGGAIDGGERSSVETQVWLTAPIRVAAVEFRLRLEGVPDAEFRVSPYDKTYADFSKLGADGRTVVLIPDTLYDTTRDRRIPASEAFPLFNVVVCVPAGTAAGTYGLYLDDARVGIREDFNAHIPQAVSADIAVRAPVTAASCPDPSEPLPDLVPGPADVEYVLAGPAALGPEDKTFAVSVLLRSAYPVASLDFAIDYSEYILQLQDVEKVLSAGGVTPRAFEVEIGPQRTETIVNDPAEGYVALRVKMDPLPEGVAWESGTFYEVARLNFNVRRPIDTLYGETVLRFCDVGADRQHWNIAWTHVDGASSPRGIVTTNLSIPLPGADPPVVSVPEEADVTYRLSEATGLPGARGVPVFAYIDTNTRLEDCSMAVAYDASILELESATSLMNINGEALDGWGVYCWWSTADPDAVRGVCLSGDPYLYHSSNFTRPLWYYPDPDEPVACMRFHIREDAPPGAVADLTFDFGIEHWLLGNWVRVSGRNVPPDLEPAEIRVLSFVRGKVIVEMETSIFFLRADANGDDLVNIADAVSILMFLFADGPRPRCPDAADTNDDGAIDIADPVTLLATLFSSVTTIRSPYPWAGVDPTPDQLGSCEH
jgi:hypothetical protein